MNGYANLLTCLVNFDFWLAAFFQWITFFLANLSIMEETSFNKASASDFTVALLSFLTKVRVVLCWYLFLRLLASFARILFSADLWFAIGFSKNKDCKGKGNNQICKTFVISIPQLTTKKLVWTPLLRLFWWDWLSMLPKFIRICLGSISNLGLFLLLH